MEKVTNWTELMIGSLSAFGESFMRSVPMILGAIAILLIGWLLAKLVSTGVRKLLEALPFDELADKMQVSDFLGRANVKMRPSALIGKFVYWLLLLLVFMTASDALGWSAVTKEISNLIGYLPQLLIAVVFFIIGTFIATFVRDLIKGATSSLGISTGNLLSSAVFYFLMILVALTALEQAGFDTSIITSNLMLIFGAILAAAAVSYAIASKNVMENIIAGYFSRKTFNKGQEIEVGNVKGKIIDMNATSVTIEQAGGDHVVIPSNDLITSQTTIKKG